MGINLLREGLDIPEISLVAILDADKEGFLRTETSLIQTIGRAARHSDGKVMLNEPNTIPGFTSISMYPKMFAASGIPYGELIDRLFTLALEKWER